MIFVHSQMLSEFDPVLLAHAKRIDEEKMADIFDLDSKRVHEIAKELMEVDRKQ